MSTATQEKLKKRFIYNLDALTTMPEGPNSCSVAPSRLLSGDTLETGKSTTRGPVLSGSHVHVAWVVKPRGTGSKLHTHPNEQFNIVLQGKLVVEIDGGTFEAPAMNMIHMPAGVQHCTIASGEGDVMFFVIKDTSHGMAGPPVDGIEDGPRYLPGFGPAKK
jgi:quercetin dioxygenase-like cupin family protein